MGGRVIQLVVDAKHDHQVWALGRGRDDDLLGTSGQVLGGVVSGRKQPGRLEHDLHTEVAPREGRRVTLGQDLERAVSDADPVALERHRLVQIPQDRVVFEQVGERFRAGDVVDGYELKLTVVLERRPQDVTPNPPKSVDSDLDGGKYPTPFVRVNRKVVRIP